MQLFNISFQVNIPSLNRSCLDHFNHGSKTSGYYTILDLKEKARTVYCDMESEPGSVWTLVMSFTRENKDVNAFRSKAMYERSATNPSTPNWTKYRMSYSLMHRVKSTGELHAVFRNMVSTSTPTTSEPRSLILISWEHFGGNARK
jgi:hypothetical protein